LRQRDRFGLGVAVIFGMSRCGLSGWSVTRPRPWKLAPAPMRPGSAVAVRITSGGGALPYD